VHHLQHRFPDYIPRVCTIYSSVSQTIFCGCAPSTATFPDYIQWNAGVSLNVERCSMKNWGNRGFEFCVSDHSFKILFIYELLVRAFHLVTNISLRCQMRSQNCKKQLLVSHPSVRPSLWYISVPTGMDFHENLYLSIFRNSGKNIQVSLKADKSSSMHLHDGHCAFMIVSSQILHRMRNVSDKSCRENQNTHLVFSIFYNSFCL
jgi:hypothetical protein